MDPPWRPHGPEPLPEENDKPTLPASDEVLSEEDTQYVGKLKLADVFEVDIDLNTRPWMPLRESETKWEAKRWCVVGVLVRR